MSMDPENQTTDAKPLEAEAAAAPAMNVEDREEAFYASEPAPHEDRNHALTHEIPPVAVAPEREPAGEISPVWISFQHVDEDTTFRVRPETESTLLATDIARLGQLYPIDVRPSSEGRYQIICGFRRVAALKFLQRQRVLARVHEHLSDEDALLMALASAIHAVAVSRGELEQMAQRLDSEGKLSPAARDMLEKALSPEDNLSPESVEEEVDADELADDVTLRLAEINQDLSLLADVFASLDETKREELLQQLRYSSELVTFLEEK